jgi:hypothetical protein
VKDTPLTIHVVGDSASVQFTWITTAGGGGSTMFATEDFKVVNATIDSIHLEHQSAYYNKFQDGKWYNKEGQAVGTFQVEAMAEYRVRSAQYR